MKLVLRPSDMLEATGYSLPSIYRLEKEGTFPKRKQLGASAVGWLTSEVLEWLNSRPTVNADNVRTVAVGAKRGRPRKDVAQAA